MSINRLIPQGHLQSFRCSADQSVLGSETPEHTIKIERLVDRSIPNRSTSRLIEAEGRCPLGDTRV
jgi:hypothetical protein